MITKFKVWDKHNEQMIEWIDLDFSKDNGKDFITVFEPTGIVRDAIISPILLQSTGLFDKNGKEIFEGDILKENSMLGIVKFGRYLDYEYIQYGLDGWLFSEKLKLGFVDTPLTEYVLDPHCSIEVIGNVYQHPHLLEEE
ncbi:YopX family protein [Mammaliicoccus lentus]|uniref:YopX family protein n=1 Tax=Mammaliicoccus lentus TaxID=42858 RepID=UPI002648DD21|nr:YopX family protein [Mammaliicoccus lentus]